MKTLPILIVLALLPMSGLTLSSCANMGSAAGVVQSAQQWLSDPAHQQEISAIANTVIGLVGALGKRSETTKATITGRLAKEHPNVPAGALAEIVKNPHAYAK